MKFLLSCFLLCLAIPSEARADKDPQFGSDLDTPLAIAAAAGDAGRVTALLDKGEPIDGRDSGGRTPLMCAAIAGRTEVVRLLLARHADPNRLAVRSGMSPLDFALGWHHDDLVPMLLDAGADPNGFRATNSRGATWSPLFAALTQGHVAPVKTLLAHGARLEDRNSEGDTALMQACKRPHAEALAVLIEHGADVNAHKAKGFTGLIYACYNGCEDNVRLLLAKGADIHAVARSEDNDLPYGPLEAAEEGGQPFVLEALAAAGATPARPKAKLTDELNEAIAWNRFEAVQAAISKGAPLSDPDSSDILPLDKAILCGDPSIVQLLLKSGADVNSSFYRDGRTPPLTLAEERLAAQKDPEARQKFARIVESLRQAHAAR